MDQLLGRLRELDAEQSTANLRVLVGVASRGSVGLTELGRVLGMPKQTTSLAVRQLTFVWDRKRQELLEPKLPLLVRIKRPGKPIQLRLSRTGLALLREAGLLPSEEPSNDPAA